MPKETVYSTHTGRNLIGQLICHPVRGVGLVTGHMIYPYESVGSKAAGSVWTVLWTDADGLERVERHVISACTILGDSQPPI